MTDQVWTWIAGLKDEYVRRATEGRWLEDQPLYDVRVMGIALVSYYLLVLLCYLVARQTTLRFPWLRTVMHAYDVIAVAWNSLLVYWTLQHVQVEPILLGCNVLDHFRMDSAFLRVHYFAFAIKFFELTDTFFIILGRRYSQLSFLHLYHHGSILLVGWISSVYSYYGDYSLLFFMNAIVHILMYSYYLFPRALGFLKKALTKVQIIQFFIGLALMLCKIVLGCESSWIAVLLLFYYASLLVLFLRFYGSTYGEGGRQSKAALKKE